MQLGRAPALPSISSSKKQQLSYMLPPFAWKVRNVALSVRIYAPISSAITRQAPMPALAEVYQSV